MSALALPAEVRDYLGAQSVMTLATQDAGGPWAAAVFYAQLDDDLVFVSSPRSRHAGQLVRDGRCAATIHAPADDWTRIRGIQLEGRVDVLDASAREMARVRYGEKFPFARPALAAAPILQALARVQWYRLCIARLWFIDNARGFGQRQVYEATKA